MLGVVIVAEVESLVVLVSGSSNSNRRDSGRVVVIIGSIRSQ